MQSNIHNESETIKNLLKDIERYAQDQKEFLSAIELFERNNLDILDKQEQIEDKQRYHIDELLKYNDKEFIQNCYLSILKREVDEASLEHYLDYLREKGLSKEKFITILSESEEAKKHAVIIDGKKNLKGFFYKFKEKIKKFKSFFLVVQKLEKLEVQIYKQQSIQNDINFLFQKEINIKANKSQVANLTRKTEQKLKDQLQFYIQQVAYINRSASSLHQKLRDLLEQVEKNIPQSQIAQKLEDITNANLDALYLAFEDKFRGNKSDIQNRLKIYLPFIKSAYNNTAKLSVLDVGCGRGEWLQLLKEEGYKAKGIDLNSMMVEEAKKANLDVEIQDVITYLKSLEHHSLSSITGFHIVEHLPFKTLIELLDLALMALANNGVAIFETPNPENIFVGSKLFYTDPTHLNPLNPETLKFLLEQRGFRNVQIKRLHKYLDYYEPQITNEFLEQNFYNELDFAVIGYR